LLRSGRGSQGLADEISEEQEGKQDIYIGKGIDEPQMNPYLCG
jgi:hypothetical protein